MDVGDLLKFINIIIMGGTVAAGIYIKKLIKNVKIGKFQLIRVLPLLILIVGETLSILYGLITEENIVLSISKGLIISCISAFGYDIYKSLFGKGVASEEDKK